MNKSIIDMDRQRLAAIREGARMFYFGVPIHLNIGDVAQTYCTEQWIYENYGNIAVYEFHTPALLDPKFLSELKKAVRDDDLIVVQSGYCSHQGHMDHRMHKKIVPFFKNNRILILPQTINITSEREWEETAKAFATNPKLIFMTRDKISYESASRHIKNEIINYPDIVTTLIGSRDPLPQREGILLCMRNDSEKFYRDSEYLELKKKINLLGIKVDRTDTTLKGSDSDTFYSNFEAILEETLREFEKHRLIITDRYHGVILASIANTPVIVLKTNDHKVTSGIDWFTENGYQNIYYANDMENAYQIAKEKYMQNTTIKNSDIFKTKYYQNLKNVICNLWDCT